MTEIALSSVHEIDFLIVIATCAIAADVDVVTGTAIATALNGLASGIVDATVNAADVFSWIFGLAAMRILNGNGKVAAIWVNF